MTIEYYKPKNPILQKYIEGFYFLTNTVGELGNSYLTFPNNYCIVSVTNKCNINFAKEKVIVSEDGDQKCFSSIISNYKKPIQIEYYGNVKELPIYFKPVGINNFIQQKLIAYLNDSFQIFNPFDDFLETMQLILKTVAIEDARVMVEDYWLSKLTSFDGGFLTKAIILLEDYEMDYSIQQVADLCSTSRQNLFKAFKIHLGKTPSDYKKIHRFRKALNQYRDKKNNKNLSSLLVNSTFYDQSHFIKDFKSFTGLAPKDLFKDLDYNKGEDIKWLWI